MKMLAPLCLAACLVSSAFAADAFADIACDDNAAPLQTAGAGGAAGASGGAGEGNPAPRPRGNRCSGDDDDDGCSVDRVGQARGGKFGLAALMALAGAGALVADRRRGG